MSYAEGTTVSIERSQMEIATMIRKYGAQSFGTGWNAGHALVRAGMNAVSISSPGRAGFHGSRRGSRCCAFCALRRAALLMRLVGGAVACCGWPGRRW